MNPEPESNTGRSERRRWPRGAWISVIVLAAIALFFALGHLVAWLWSFTVSDIFGWKHISFWQAWGLILLSQILFKANVSSGARPSASRRRKRRAEAEAEGAQ